MMLVEVAPETITTGCIKMLHIEGRVLSGIFAPFQKRTMFLHVKPYLMCMEGHFLTTHGCLVY